MSSNLLVYYHYLYGEIIKSAMFSRKLMVQRFLFFPVGPAYDTLVTISKSLIHSVLCFMCEMV